MCIYMYVCHGMILQCDFLSCVMFAGSKNASAGRCFLQYTMCMYDILFVGIWGYFHVCKVVWAKYHLLQVILCYVPILDSCVHPCKYTLMHTCTYMYMYIFRDRMDIRCVHVVSNKSIQLHVYTYACHNDK